jgi:signal transduction histidine kinase
VPKHAAYIDDEERIIGASELEERLSEMQAARDEARAASRAKTAFLANVGHELLIDQ